MRYISIGSRYIFLNPYLISVYQLEEFHHSYGKLLYNQGQLAVVLLLSIVGFLRFHEIPGARLRLWEGFPPKNAGKTRHVPKMAFLWDIHHFQTQLYIWSMYVDVPDDVCR